MKKYLLLAFLATAIGCKTTKITSNTVPVASALDEWSHLNKIGKFQERFEAARFIAQSLPDTIPSVIYGDSLFILDENLNTYYIKK